MHFERFYLDSRLICDCDIYFVYIMLFLTVLFNGLW